MYSLAEEHEAGVPDFQSSARSFCDYDTSSINSFRRGQSLDVEEEEEEDDESVEEMEEQKEEKWPELHPAPPLSKSSLPFPPPSPKAKNIDANQWISASQSNGYIRVHSPANLEKSNLLACTDETPAYRICLQLGLHPNALHIQYGGDFTRRVRSNEYPLRLQNDYLRSIGYDEHRRVQKLGTSWELGFMVRLLSGKICAKNKLLLFGEIYWNMP